MDGVKQAEFEQRFRRRFRVCGSKQGVEADGGMPNKYQPYAYMGAAYLFDQDSNGNWTQTTELLASDSKAYRRFGTAVSINESLALVSAPGAYGFGEPTEGAAYLFESNENDSWQQVAKFTSEIRPGDLFALVALSGRTAFVGYPGEFLGGTSYGAVHVFDENGNGEWNRVQKIIANSPTLDFGEKVSISGTTMVVSGSVPTDGAIEPTAFILKSDSQGQWHEITRLIPEESSTTGYYAVRSVAIDGDIAIVSDESVAYAFREFSDGTWKQIARLEPFDPDGFRSERFGSSVAIQGWTIVVAPQPMEVKTPPTSSSHRNHRRIG